ncbi:MAG: hypothetical protein AAFY22_08250 [Pseudomonadota bacterium]
MVASSPFASVFSIASSSVAKTIAARALVGASALALAACATTGGENQAYKDAIDVYTSPSAAPSSKTDPIAAAAFWGTRYNRDQKDPRVAVEYSRSLRKIGSVAEAVKVATKSALVHENNPEVFLEAGKALIEADRSFEAVRYIELATSKRPNDWSAFSAYGVALDQIGEHELARSQYDRALSIAPGAVNVLNNKALSYALSGNLRLAEATLRTAAGSAGADARMRQNLALVLALKGDVTQAERLARSDLPPQVADQNIAYFRSLLSQPAYWAQYGDGDFDAPVFDEPEPETPATSAPQSLSPPPVKPAPKPEEPAKPKSNQPIASAPKNNGATGVTPAALTPAAVAVEAAPSPEPAIKDVDDTISLTPVSVKETPAPKATADENDIIELEPAPAAPLK